MRLSRASWVVVFGLASCNSVSIPQLPTYSFDGPGSVPHIIPNWDDAVATLPCGDFTQSAPLTASSTLGVFPPGSPGHKWNTSVTIVADGLRFDPGEIEDPAGWAAIERKFDQHIGPGC